MTQNVTAIKIDRNTLRPFIWLGALVAFIAFVWLFKSILLPFVLGLAIAYLLEPVVEKLAAYKVPRIGAVLSILGLFVLLIVGLIAAIAPIAYREIMQLAQDFPTYVERAHEMAAPYMGWIETRLEDGQMEDIKTAITDNIGNTLKAGGGVLAGIASGGAALAGFLYTLVLTPIVAFFMMMEWPRITAWIDNMIPRKSYDTIKDLLHRMDVKIAGFVRGQIMVASFLGGAYAIALSVAGLKFGFLIGLLAGVLSIIPMVGSTVGLVTSLAVAWFQAGTWAYVGIIAAIFAAGQFIEGNFLTPKIMGDKVGLHPLWIIFALSAGGALFGIVGMLLAIPLAAVIGVLASFAIARYKESDLYA